MKNQLRYLLQNLLGFRNYLFLFSIYSIKRLAYNRYEKEFLHFLQLIPNRGIVLDIGANIGITTVPLARKLNKTLIHSYEPMPENVEALNRVIRFFKAANTRVFPFALGSRAGQLKMVMPILGNAKMQGLSHTWQEGDMQNGEIVTVPVHVLDDLYGEESQPITAIKIDVENFEYEVLKGAAKLLQKHKPLIYSELWDNDVRTSTIAYLKSLGYKAMVYNGRLLVPFEGQRVTNYFFLPL